MDKMFAKNNNCKKFNFVEHEHRSLPKEHATDIPEGDSTSRAVTMYFRRIGLHALLSRKDEVEIAKRIEQTNKLVKPIETYAKTIEDFAVHGKIQASLFVDKT